MSVNPQAAAEFERCAPWLQAALVEANGTHTLIDIAAGIELGHYQFWPGNKCAIVTEIQVYPRRKFLNLFLGGGDMSEIIDMLPMIEDWARAYGCEEIVEVGRPGWERVLGRHGWKKRAVVLAKPIGRVTLQ